MHSEACDRSELADTNLLPAVHNLNRSFNGLDFIHGVLRLNVLPVLTVGRPVAAALPVSPGPGGENGEPVMTRPHIGMRSTACSGGEVRHIRSDTLEVLLLLHSPTPAPTHPHTKVHFHLSPAVC